MYSLKSEEIIKKEMLDNIKNTVDKSENSFIHDAISPAALQFMIFYQRLEYEVDKMNIESKEGGELEQYIYQESGLERKSASKAQAVVTITGEVGAIFSEGDLVSTDTINFVSIESKTIPSSGTVQAIVVCEEEGTVGNVPPGAINMFPVELYGLTGVTNKEAVTSGYDQETDREFIDRHYEKIRTPAISGNKHHYRNWAKEVTGVGDARIISLWDGAGTVKVVLIDDSKQSAPEDLVKKVADHIEEQRPIGADVTVSSAIPKRLSVTLKLVSNEDFTLEQVKASIEKSIDRYLKETAFKVDFISYARIGKAILDTEGVLDYSGLKINGGIENISVAYEEVPVLNEVVIYE